MFSLMLLLTFEINDSVSGLFESMWFVDQLDDEQSQKKLRNIRFLIEKAFPDTSKDFSIYLCENDAWS